MPHAEPQTVIGNFLMIESQLGDTADFELPPALRRPKPKPPAVEVEVAGQSDQGKVRANNEDHFLIARYGRFLEPLQTNMPDDDAPALAQDTGYAMVVADGLGGGA